MESIPIAFVAVSVNFFGLVWSLWNARLVKNRHISGRIVSRGPTSKPVCHGIALETISELKIPVTILKYNYKCRPINWIETYPEPMSQADITIIAMPSARPQNNFLLREMRSWKDKPWNKSASITWISTFDAAAAAAPRARNPTRIWKRFYRLFIWKMSHNHRKSMHQEWIGSQDDGEKNKDYPERHRRKKKFPGNSGWLKRDISSIEPSLNRISKDPNKNQRNDMCNCWWSLKYR